MLGEYMSVLQLFLSDDVMMEDAQALVGALLCGPQGVAG